MDCKRQFTVMEMQKVVLSLSLEISDEQCKLEYNTIITNKTK